MELSVEASETPYAPVAADSLAPKTPEPIPGRISSSIRWTLWLSLLALPFSYGTNILLARLGPEALGTFGVLNTYIGIVFVFFFLGGCAVPFRFLPALTPDKRSSFLASYSLVILIGLLPWVVLAKAWPQVLHFLFGNAGTPDLQMKLIYLSPHQPQGRPRDEMGANPRSGNYGCLGRCAFAVARN